MENKYLIALVVSIVIGLMGFSLKTIYSMNGEIIKLQQGQIVLSNQIEQNTNFVKKQIRKLTKRSKNKKNKKNKKNQNQ